jgi:transposase
MESTGVYWRPVYAVLEGDFDLIVGNARHIRNVPGRKTDVKDAEWIADLVRHGLIAKSFVPPPPLRELRELLPQRFKVPGHRPECADFLGRPPTWRADQNARHDRLLMNVEPSTPLNHHLHHHLLDKAGDRDAGA